MEISFLQNLAILILKNYEWQHFFGIGSFGQRRAPFILLADLMKNFWSKLVYFHGLITPFGVMPPRDLLASK